MFLSGELPRLPRSFTSVRIQKYKITITMKKSFLCFLRNLVYAILISPVLFLFALNCVDICGPGAPDFFNRHPVFKCFYVVSHIIPVFGDGIFTWHIK